MTLSQNLVAGPLWAARRVVVQPVEIQRFYYWGRERKVSISGHLPLSATFKTFLHLQRWNYLLPFLCSHHPPNHRGREAIQWKRLACHPSISGHLRISYNDILNHISIAGAFISYSFLMLLPHLPFSLHSLAGYQIIDIDYTLYSSSLSLLLFLSVYSRVLSYWTDT